mgnify:CR=1 FL=1
MKKHLFFIAALVLGMSTEAAETISVSSSVSANIEINAAGEYLLQGDGSKCEYQIIVAENLGDVTLVLDQVNVEVTGDKDAGISALVVKSGTTATIQFKGSNILKSTCDPGCGIEALGNIVLAGEDDAVLTCSAKGWAAAIGSTPRPKGKVNVSGDITINSGIINASAGWESPAIGASVDCAAHKITINGGQITAKGGAQGAGIGTGYSQWGESNGNGTITINGGTVLASAGSNESDWGPDNDLVPIGVVKGTGATIKVEINGGNVKAMRSDGSEFPGTIAATDKNGTELKLFKAQLQNTTEPTRVTGGTVGTVTLGEGGYGMNDVYTDATGWLYLYLPEQAADAAVNLIAEGGTGVENVENNVKVRVAERRILIEGAAGQSVSLFDLSGRQLTTTIANDALTEISAEAGMYIVGINGKAHKVIVR